MAIRDRLNALLEKFEPELRDAFLAAFADISRQADLKTIVDRLEAGDVDGALRAVHVDAAAFRAVEEAINSAFAAGGSWQVSKFPKITTRTGQRLVIRFDGRNPRAERILAEYSSTLVREIVADQVTMIRANLSAAMEAGTNPRTAALDLVGRIDRATNERVGSIIGLTSQQEKFARNAGAELASSDPADLEKWLARKLRDRRYDSTVRKAIKNGTGIDATTAKTMLTRYRSSFLKLRGETIARTEAMTALHMGQDEGVRQLVGTGQVQPGDVRRVWRSAADERVRETHRALDGMSVALDEPFISPSGAQIMFPGDPDAPAEETINCRCDMTVRIDFLANIANEE